MILYDLFLWGGVFHFYMGDIIFKVHVAYGLKAQAAIKCFEVLLCGNDDDLRMKMVLCFADAIVHELPAITCFTVCRSGYNAANGRIIIKKTCGNQTGISCQLGLFFVLIAKNMKAAGIFAIGIEVNAVLLYNEYLRS